MKLFFKKGTKEFCERGVAWWIGEAGAGWKRLMGRKLCNIFNNKAF